MVEAESKKVGEGRCRGAVSSVREGGVSVKGFEDVEASGAGAEGHREKERAGEPRVGGRRRGRGRTAGRRNADVARDDRGSICGAGKRFEGQ